MKKENNMCNVPVWRFFLPAALGIGFFLLPVRYQGMRATAVVHVANGLCTYAGGWLPRLMVGALGGSAVLTLLGKCGGLGRLQRNAWVDFEATPFWLVVRLVGGVAAVLVFFKVGPAWLWDASTGGEMLFSLLPRLFANLLVASFLSPLLFDFGLLEFVGTFMEGIMRPLFNLPGSAALDCVSSWLGDGTMGTVISIQEYEKGHYTKRETCFIISAFSAVSVTFYVTILTHLSLQDYFGAFLLTTLVSSFVAALVLRHLPPISRKANTYIGGQDAAELPKKAVQRGNMWRRALQAALCRTATGPSLKACCKKSIQNTLETLVKLLPGVMTLGLCSLLLATYTPVFHVVGRPFVPLLRWLGVPGAQEASACMLVGFADMFMPVAMAKGIAFPMTRFVVGALSVTQIVYLSELGPLLLGRKGLRITLLDLAGIFLLRTFITLPVIVFFARCFF